MTDATEYDMVVGKMKTLLEKAREFQVPKDDKLGKEDAELALAWFVGKIRPIQVSKAKGFTISSGKVYSYLAKSLKKAFELGWIKDVRKELK